MFGSFYFRALKKYTKIPNPGTHASSTKEVTLLIAADLYIKTGFRTETVGGIIYKTLLHTMTRQTAPGSQLQVREPGAGSRFDFNLELERLVCK